MPLAPRPAHLWGVREILIDFPDDDGHPRRLVFGAPRELLVARTLAEVRPMLARVERAAAAGAWAAGYVSYEAAPAFDPAMRVREGTRLPLLCFGLHDAPAYDDVPQAMDGDARVAGAPAADAWTPDTPRDAYERAIHEVRDAIARGDVYQVNHTLRLHAPFAGDARAWYERLRRAQGGGWCAWLDLAGVEDAAICSASPELFFTRRGRALVTRPMKGTAPRGRWSAEDDAAAAALAASPKERAENVMIVDLLRNDLGRVAETGSVRVPALCAVERYRTLWQMTSTIEATLKAGATLDDVFAALFPCGSVTGAPKIAATRIIAALERAPREVYCGAIGVVRPGGDCAFSVPIRTVWIDRARGVAEYGVGGGITWDSTPAGEYAELLAKAAVLDVVPATPTLLETMRLDAAAYARREAHLARMAASARYHAIPFDAPRVAAALDAHATGHAHDAGPRRARLLLAPDGTPRVESAPLDATPPRPRVQIAPTPVRSSDRRLYHKTTQRELYAARRAERPDAWDVLLVNERGELTELTIGNLVVELDGIRVTPPLACGLLPGVFRAELLARGEVEERAVRVEELARATRVWLVNSVREWVEVTVSNA